MNYKEVIVAVGVLVLLFKLDVLENPFQGKPAFVDGYSDEVVFYSTSWCGYCKKARKLLDEEGIEYTEYDIERSTKGREEYDQLDGKGIPLFVINGEVLRGYNPQEILALSSVDY